MNFDMNDQKKALWDGFFSVFNFGSFFDDSKIRISQKDYLLSLIKDRDEDLVNLRNDWKKILSADFNQSINSKEGGRGAKRKGYKIRKSTK